MKSQRSTGELRKAVAALRPHFLQAAAFSLFASLLILAPSGYMLEVYGRVVNSRSHLTLAMLTLLVLAAYCLMEVLDWARTEIMYEAGQKLDQAIRYRVFDAMFEASLKREPGGNIQPMGDVRILREFLYSPPLLALMEAPISLVLMAMMYAISPLLGWSAVVGAVIQVGVAWLNDSTTRPSLVIANRSAVAAQHYADGCLRNAQVIASMGMLCDVHRRWMGIQREFLSLQALASERAGAWQAITKFLQVTMSSLLLGLGAWLLLNNQLNGGAGMMIVGSILGGRVLAPLVQMVTHWRAVVGARDAWQRLDGLLVAIPPKALAMALPAPKGFLQVESLVAGAPGSQGNSTPIVRNIAFSLQPGEVLGVIGPSAAGKTTLARLIVGLWPAAGGKVRLDGADIFAWDKDELGPHLGYLPQEIELTDGTLAENIARFGEVRPAKVRAAALAVDLHGFIMSLPLGYDTPVGRDGCVLSGGQRQRVALARALYGDPVLVVLDEPNSSLDEAGDAALVSAILDRKSHGTTFVVMTHRASVLTAADKLLVMRDGAMQAFGPCADVLNAMKQASAQAAAQAWKAEDKAMAEAA
jgi:ATP-binding cassette subfamily C exporter for protease/lipase